MTTIIELPGPDKDKELWQWLCQHNALTLCLLVRIESVEGCKLGPTLSVGNVTTLGGYEIAAEVTGDFCGTGCKLMAMSYPANREEHERLLSSLQPGTCWLAEAEMLLWNQVDQMQLMGVHYQRLPEGYDTAAQRIFLKHKRAGSPSS